MGRDFAYRIVGGYDDSFEDVFELRNSYGGPGVMGGLATKKEMICYLLELVVHNNFRMVKIIAGILEGMEDGDSIEISYT